MKKYIPTQIEGKWQQKWLSDQVYKQSLRSEDLKIDLNQAKDKYYLLVEFTYPSGDLHMGHWFTFAVPDILARLKRMQGYNVFFPNGFDAFGLPAENAAIKRHIHPRDWTLANIERMKQQFSTMGASFDWEYEVITCMPNYYHWNQWLFLKMYEKGLAYKGKLLSNWCPNCQTVLANENVESGKCWRCGTEVVLKEVEQWFFKITEYADRLIWPETPAVDWPKPVREGQNNWIGKSAGLVIVFELLEVFTTRPDTLFGVSFLVISPEHPLLKQFLTPEKTTEVEEYVLKAKKKSELERKEAKEKTGVFTGSYVKHPLTGKQIPVWVADYVLAGYGTGAVMGVPAHDQRDFEFASKLGLEIVTVIEPQEGNQHQDAAYSGEGKIINSGEYSGLDSATAREKISEYIISNQLGVSHTQYHLHDWSISRQRYWGTPIPMIYCDNCGTVPVPETDLPVELPYQVDYTPQGKPPLATAEDWVNVKCPKCGGEAKRDSETMDTFVDSSWYFFRYLDPKNTKQIFEPKLAQDWMPVDIYFGGAEHTLGHTLYSRFVSLFIHDLGLTDIEEYALKRVNHGVILGPDGHRMSKSRGNVVNPDQEVKQYGADAVRLYLAFLGPYDIVAPWNSSGINGVYHFLQRVWYLSEKVTSDGTELSSQDLKIMHKTIKKVGDDINDIKFNTGIAALMEWLNHLSKKEQISKQEYKTFLQLLAPYAPHITEELWEIIGEKYSIHQQLWPEFDSSLLIGEEVQVVIQVNGKVREMMVISKDILKSEKNSEDEQGLVQKQAADLPKVQKFLEGKTIRKIIYVPGKVVNFVVN